jgi:KDO2-lipid IV(A) lauroyltransferase
MSKPRSVVADYAVYLAIRLLVAVIEAIPYQAACSLAAALAWLAYHVNRRHRSVALDNLRHAFPGRYTEAQLDRLVRAVYRHFFTLLIDVIHLPRRIQPTNWREHVILDQGVWTDLLLSGRSLLLVTGHFGNWELGSYVLGLLGVPTYAVARPLDNPFVDEYLRRFRERSGQKILAKKGDFDKMQEILAGGGVLGTVADQDAGARGQFVEFFGRPASTHRAIALLALEYNVPLLVTGVRKEDAAGLRYRVLVEDVIWPEEHASDRDPVKAITQRFSSALERIIRTAPEQYFWLHRRWKHQPKPKKRKTAA